MHRAVILLAAIPLLGQNKRVSLPGMDVTAEYLLHSIPTERGFYFTKDYLVVEVGVFPSKTERIKVFSGQFTLRINHGKTTLVADTPGTVAASLQYPDWEQRPNLTAQAGPVIFGAPPEVGRFPGDPRGGQPLPPPAKPDPDPSGLEKGEPKTIAQLLALAGLPEGLVYPQAKGCLFFRFRGKTKSIRSLELLYDAGDGRPPATIPLF